ncbi:hypothetical protein IWW50_006636 [Coemansia erecta]|nr:hypothetical protein GGF43_005428 [Coemansia sp. RSA 2618]KAJ2816026.1 hypothetical protein IWW50_006636 [Coemansia erecta]
MVRCRVRVLVFLCAVAALAALASYMFASYIDEAAASANYLSLGFDHVFVPSTRPHIARRKFMSTLLRSQGIPHGFFPATAAYDIDHPDAYSFWLGEEHWPPPENATLSAPDLAAFRTHMNVINDVIRLEYASALVLGDQVDIAADIKQQMHSIAKRLPATWDLVLLGHCAAQAALRPTHFHPRVSVAADPKCVFAYALSRACAVRLKRVLDRMWPAPPMPFAQVLGDMVASLFLEAYAVDPPLVALVHRTPSDLYAPSFYMLGNSTLDRLGLLSR